jgi:hypothetical protein
LLVLNDEASDEVEVPPLLAAALPAPPELASPALLRSSPVLLLLR